MSRLRSVALAGPFGAINGHPDQLNYNRQHHQIGLDFPSLGKFSQETLAEMIGTTRSRVSFFMNKFRKLGFIEYTGKLEVHNSLLNVVLHDKPEIKTRDEAIGTE
jgi:hypothetical protein